MPSYAPNLSVRQAGNGASPRSKPSSVWSGFAAFILIMKPCSLTLRFRRFLE